MKQYLYSLLVISLCYQSIAASENKSINKILLVNKTDHIIRNLKVKFTFIGKNDAAEQNHTWGKVWIKNLVPDKGIIVDPHQAIHAGVIGKVYEHFENPRIAIQRIDAGKAHRGFGKPGSFKDNTYVIYERDGQEIIRSYDYYKDERRRDRR